LKKSYTSPTYINFATPRLCVEKIYA